MQSAEMIRKAHPHRKLGSRSGIAHKFEETRSSFFVFVPDVLFVSFKCIDYYPMFHLCALVIFEAACILHFNGFRRENFGFLECVVGIQEIQSSTHTTKKIIGLKYLHMRHKSCSSVAFSATSIFVSLLHDLFSILVMVWVIIQHCHLLSSEADTVTKWLCLTFRTIK